MTDAADKRSRVYSGHRFLALIAIPTMIAATVLCLAAFAALHWAVTTVDRAAVGRQKALMSVVVDNLRSSIAHDQESVTVWDEAVLAMRNPPYPTWIDANLGSWMHTYFGHDGVYVLDSTDVPVFAYEHASLVPLQTYEHIRSSTSRLAAKLRARLVAGDTKGISDRNLSLGESDFAFDEGRPAIISVKPIVSGTGTISQTPGTEYLHVAVRFLDGSFLGELSSRYLFEDLAFAPVVVAKPGWESYPIRNAEGRSIGNFVWRPVSPGTELLDRILLPTAAGFLALLAALVVALLSIHRRAVFERQAADRIRHLAFHDALTELPNRHAFERRIQEVLAAHPKRGALLYIDLDHFNVINDSFGHATGDIAVHAVSERIAAICGDDVYRTGGDEFMVIVPGRTTKAAVETAQAIIAALVPPVIIGDVHAFISASIGIASFAEAPANGFELFRKADVALYQAKTMGRGGVAVYDRTLDAEIRGTAAIERDLRSALARPGEIEVHYQPVYDAKSRKVVAVEALARWRHPQHGLIPPSEFIPVAENTGLIRDIGLIVLEAACSAAVRWDISLLAVNVSAVQLRDAGFVAQVADILQCVGLPPGKLEIEITETAWLAPGGFGEASLAALRATGVAIALDDFGTGFSSLGRLSETAFDRIKIDQHFVKKALQSPRDAAVVKTIVELARAHGSKTTAEGVETAEAADFLTRIGCDDLQGYWFSRPLPFAEVDAMLRPQTVEAG